MGIERITDLCKEYGKETFLEAMDGLLDHSEALTRQAIFEIPDGTYSFTGYIDNDGVDFDKPIKLQLAVTISGSEILFDFTGSSPQTKGPINCVYACLLYTSGEQGLPVYRHRRFRRRGRRPPWPLHDARRLPGSLALCLSLIHIFLLG